MEKETFINHIANQFDETDISEFNSDTIFRNLEEWSSLTRLAIVNMIEKKYDVKINADDMHSVKTIGELYTLVNLKH